MNAPVALSPQRATPATGAERAAIMVMLLAEDDATRILAQLSPDELRDLTTTMCALGDVDQSAIEDAIGGFARSAEAPPFPDHGRIDGVRKLLSGAVGEMKATNLMRTVLPDAREAPSPTFELLSWLEPKIVAELLEDEYPQAIAVVLLQLQPETAAAALAALPEDLHPSILHRIASLGPVSRAALDLLARNLDQKIEQLHGAIPLEMGGIKTAAEIINRSHRSLEKRVLPSIGKLDAQLAEAIEKELFKFEHLFALGDLRIGILLREVESDTLIDALRGIDEDKREHFYSAMSSRAADGLRDEIGERGRIKRTDAENAQSQIIALAKRLAEEGALVLGDGDDDYV